MQTKSAKKYLISLLRVAPEIFSLHISQIFGSLNNIRVGTGVKISEGKYRSHGPLRFGSIELRYFLRPFNRLRITMGKLGCTAIPN